MASEREKCTEQSPDVVGPPCRLSALRKRSQLDFEIEFFERILSRDPNYLEVLVNLGDLFSRKGCHRRALQVDLRLAQLRPQNPTVFYNLACSHAVLNQVGEAFVALEQAVDLGYRDVDHLLADPDLAVLRTHSRFGQLLATLAKLDTEAGATRVV